MTREEIEEQYEVRDGVIQTLGAFEGEPWWAVQAFDAVTDGSSTSIYSGEDNGGDWGDTVEPDPAWGLDETVVAVSVEGCNDGFVTVAPLTRAELDEWITRVDAVERSRANCTVEDDGE